MKYLSSVTSHHANWGQCYPHQGTTKFEDARFLLSTNHFIFSVIVLLNQSCRVSVYKPLQFEQLVSPVGVISSDAHPFVTHYSACPPPLSPTSGPTGLPQHTWFWSFCLTSRLFSLAAPTETEQGGSKAGKRALISKEETQ